MVPYVLPELGAGGISIGGPPAASEHRRRGPP